MDILAYKSSHTVTVK